MRSPLAITDEERVWLRSRDVSDADPIAGDQYYAEHRVKRPANTTREDLPPAETEAIRALDEEALEKGKLIGKWQVTVAEDRMETLWPALVADAEKGILWAVKAMTPYGFEELDMYDEYVLTVYTPNYFEKHDVDRVRERLRDAHDVTHDLYYKPDLYTAKGIVADTAAEFGLSKPARYVG